MIHCDQLVKIYPLDGQDVIALQGLHLDVGTGERVGVIGASGSGKSTLLNIIGALDRATAGAVTVDGVDLAVATARERARFRRSSVGFVWQQSTRNLIHYLSALDNVALPMRARRRSGADRRARELLTMVGLSHRLHHRPAKLSGGEQQRAAIAVALANSPSVLLADEPTGELDSETASTIYDVLRTLTEETGLTQLVVSHDPDLADHVDRVVSVRDGRVAAEHRARTGSDRRGGYDQYSTVDRFGQIQLTEQQREAAGIEGLVEVVVDEDGLRLRPADPEGGR